MSPDPGKAPTHREAQLFNALKIARLGPWEYDVARDQFTFNDPFYAIFRTTAEAVGGYTMSPADYSRRFLHPEDAPIVATEVRKALATDDHEYKRQLEHRIVYADGEIGYVAVRFAIEKDEQGRTVRTYGVNQDITEQRRLEEAFRQAQKMDAIGQLAGGVAHAFNNLLTVIMGNTELLLSDAPDGDPKRSALTDIRSASERAASLTRQLLAFSRKQILEPRLVDVHVVLAGIENILRRLLGEEVELAIDLAAEPSWVKVDPGQFEQVVMDLALNARDAMPRGGRITIRTRNLAPAEPMNLEEAARRPLLPRVAISISDSGAGIPPDVRAHLFEPFFTTKEFGTGSGLGLATAHGIVKQSGGDITVESEPGRGTTFTVVFPSQTAPRKGREGLDNA